MANSENLVSIIMPCFNASQYIEESIKAALSQNYSHIELIVVDDGSEDNSRSILEKFRRMDSRIIIDTQKNRGPGSARNKGLVLSKGDLIAFLDADDTWHVDFLKKMTKALQDKPGAALAYCGWQNFGLDPGRCTPYIPIDYEAGGKQEKIIENTPWPIHAAVTRREAIVAVGGFNEKLTSCMDYDLWLRLAMRYRIVRVPDVLAYYRHHDGHQITKNHARIAENHWRIQLAYLKQNPGLEKTIGRGKLRHLTTGKLLKRGYESYWRRDLETARYIFRLVMKHGYGSMRDWKYMLPSLLPIDLHKRIVNYFDRGTPNGGNI